MVGTDQLRIWKVMLINLCHRRAAARGGPRGHWGIKNKLFHVKGDSFGKGRHVLGSHRSWMVMSLLHGTAINLLRGQSPLWSDGEPLTGRAQRVSVHPLTILSAANGP